MTKFSNKKACGDWGEKVAAQYLKGLGYQLITANYRCSGGEIDLIGKDGAVWCFIEVKTRRIGSDFGQGYEAVTAVKQRRIIKTALHFLSEQELGEAPVRFDIVSIMYFSSDDYQIELIKNAFAD